MSGGTRQLLAGGGEHLRRARAKPAFLQCFSLAAKRKRPGRDRSCTRLRPSDFSSPLGIASAIARGFRAGWPLSVLLAAERPGGFSAARRIIGRAPTVVKQKFSGSTPAQFH